MEADLRQLLTIEHDDLTSVGALDEAFCVWLRALIGPVGQGGEESFDFAVCSPKWLENEVSRQPIISGRFLLITDKFDPKAIEVYLRGRLSQATGPDWHTVANKIGRWSAWEFEDYRP